jgi:ankyrin repeat protein
MDVVKLLLERGTAPNIRNNAGQRALRYAKNLGLQRMAELLRSRRAK